LEKANGELIIPTKTGERAENNLGPRLLEQRYSVHPSPQSSEFTTIKQTVNTDDGKTETSVILTDAVKLKTGFAIVFVRRVQDLTPERYAIQSTNRKNERTFVIADLDPVLHTLFISVYLLVIQTHLFRTGYRSASSSHAERWKASQSSIADTAS
jgi:hypothetical protein